MAAYVVVQIDVQDQEKYETYKQMVAPLVAAFGGQYLVRGGEAEVLEGEWLPKRLVIIQFPSVEQAKDWWSSEAHAEAKALRHATAQSQMIVVAGV